MADKTTRHLLEWAVKGADTAAASYDALLARQMRLQTGTQSYNDMLRTSMQRTVEGVDKQTAAMRRLATEVEHVTKAAREAAEAELKMSQIPAAPGQMSGLAAHDARVAAGGSSGRSGLARIGSEIRMLPSIGIPGAGFGTDTIGNILRVAGAIQELSAGFGALLPILGAAALAVGAIAGVFLLLSQRNEESARITRTLIGLTGEYYRLALNGTQEQIQAAIEKAELDRDIAQAQVDFNRSVLQQIDQAVGTPGRAIADIFNLSGAKELREQTQSLEQQLFQSSFAVNYFSSLLDENQAAIERFAAEFEKFNLSGGERFTREQGIDEQAFLERARLVDEFTRNYARALEQAGSAAEGSMQFAIENLDMYRQQQAAYEEQRDAIEAELDFLNQNKGYYEALLQSSDASLRAAAAEQLGRIEFLEKELTALAGEGGVLTIIDQIVEGLEGSVRAAAFVAEQAQGFLEGLGTIGEQLVGSGQATLDYLAAVRAVQDAEAEHADKLLAIEQKLSDALVEAAYDRDRALEDALYEAEQRRTDITEEAAQARIDLEEDTERKRRQIERRFNRSMLNAIGERDALAAYQAQQRRDDELADLEESYDEQEETIQRRLEEQRRTIDRNLENQQRTIQRRYEDQLRTANLAHQRALQQEAQRWQEELTLRQNAMQQQLMILDNLLQAEAAMAVTGYNTLLDLGAQYWNSAISQVAQAAQQSSQSEVGSGSVGDNTIVPPEFQYHYAAGGRFSAFQAMRVGENGAETVMFDRSGYVANANATNRMAQGSGGNQANITINMDGRSLRAASRREAVRYVGEMLGDLEIE